MFEHISRSAPVATLAQSKLGAHVIAAGTTVATGACAETRGASGGVGEGGVPVGDAADADCKDAADLAASPIAPWCVRDPAFAILFKSSVETLRTKES